MPLDYFTVKPIGGLKTNVPIDDESLMQPIGDKIALTRDTGGVNVDYQSKRHACSKAAGRNQWSNTAASTTQNCLGMFELDNSDGSKSHFVFMGDGAGKGRIFRYDGSDDPVRISDVVDHAGATEWSDDELYCAVQYGNDMLFTDFGEHTPYFCDDSDTTVAKMVNAGTEYKCRYLEVFQNRIILAYTDQTDGDVEIRYSGQLPTLGAMSIDTGNQVYKPGNDEITGIKKYGSNSCFLYSTDSIDKIDYYQNYLTPFGITNMIFGNGCVNHFSIVEAFGSHFFFNRYYGFVEYKGGNILPYGGRPISEDIEDKIASISSTYYDIIVGEFNPHTNEIVWAVPLDSATTNTHLLYYHVINKSWRMEDKVAHFLDSWQGYTSLTWNNLSTWYD